MKIKLCKLVVAAVFCIVLAFTSPKSVFAADWVNIGFPEANIKTVYVNPKNNQQIFASLNNGLSNQVYSTSNGGTNWTQSTMSGSDTIRASCNSFLVNRNNNKEVWAGCNPGLFRSTDGGANFRRVEPKFSYSNVTEIVYDNSGYIYVNYDKNYLARSVDGLIWENLKVPGSTTYQRLFVDLSGSAIYVSRYSGVGYGLYQSYDKGTTWTLINNNQNINGGLDTLVISGARICGANTLGIICSSDNGLSWAAPAKPNNENLLGQRFYRIVQNPDIPENQFVLTGKWDGTDMRLYSYGSGLAVGEMVTIPNMVTEVAISQGITYTWASNTNWLKGVSRNDGVAVVPEYLKKHPVIIVPGILGSWWTSWGGWDFEPLFHTYTDLYNNFEYAGYEPGKTLFKFPYQWRADNKETAYLLKQKINEAKQASGSNKVDIVAHSMGGIVTRIYAQSPTYENDIDQIVFMGTPHLGSVSAYNMWEAADFSLFPKYMGATLSFIMFEEAKQNSYFGEDATVRYVRNNVPSINQLLPVSSYIEERTYPNNYPRNTLLESISKASLPPDIRVLNITGTGVNTPESIVSGNADSYFWPHGTCSLVKYGDGDGTVTINSQTAGISNTTNIVGGKHIDLPDKSISRVFSFLNIDQATLKITDSINEYLFVKAYSPIDFYVQAPDGKRVGFSKTSGILKEIEGAFYSGNETETEFLVIPNPKAGQYRLVTNGTGTGEYKIETTYTDETVQKEITASYIGNAAPGVEDVIISNLDSNFGEITTGIEDSLPPVTQARVEGNKQNDFYNTNVVVTLSANDDKSGVEKTEYSFDGLVWDNYDSPIVVNADGSYVINYRSTDKNGNVEKTKQLMLSRDATPPSVEVALSKTLVTRWDKILISCSAGDALSGVASTSIELGGNNLNCGQNISLMNYAAGSYEIIYKATDIAGNEAVGTKVFKVEINYSSTLKDILSAYEMGAFRNYGSMVSLYVKVKTAQVFNAFGFETRSMTLLGQVSNELNSYYSRQKISNEGYNLIKRDIEYLLEGK